VIPAPAARSASRPGDGRPARAQSPPVPGFRIGVRGEHVDPRLVNPKRRLAASAAWRAVGQELLDSGRQQERTLEALLTLATSEAGLSRREPADLFEAAALGLHRARARIQQRQLHVRARLGPAPLHGNPDLIDRLAASLVDNAVQHNLPAGTIDVATCHEDGRVILSIANTGPVVPPADIDRLFQPFQRAGDGHGLGLSIVTAIATAHSATDEPQRQAHGLTTAEGASTAW
jgi:signal transduction histidine kinase